MILLPSVSSVYSFFFYRFMIFFFRLDFKKNCSFKSSFVDFFFVKLQVFVYFSLMRGILMISSYLLMFFRFLHSRGRFLKFFHCLFLVNDVCWGRSWGWRVVRDVYVRDNFRAMYRKTSWNILNVSRVLDFIECLEMIVVDLAWICRIAAACILWCKCRISFLPLFLLNEFGWFFELWARWWLRRPRILHCIHRWLHCCLLDVWWIVPNVELLLQQK